MHGKGGTAMVLVSQSELVKKIIKLTAMRLDTKLPWLTEAIHLPECSFDLEQTSGTDGSRLCWNTEEVFKTYAEDPVLLERRYLHLILHLLYLHPYRRKKETEYLWWLACDLLTEYRIDRMNITGFERPIPVGRSRVYRKLKEEKVVLQEHSLALWLEKQKPEMIKELESTFRRDEHVYWRQTEASLPSEQRIRREKISDQAVVGLQKQLTAMHRWRTVFESLELRKSEHRRQKERCLDMDSFDYIPYDYSRRMYERLVLLEPLEYKEVRRLSDLVIAIDTSGSCSGEIVRRFLEETWRILNTEGQFFRKMNIHVIQCDCVIQEHEQITCEEEWKEYLDKVTVKGGGDTDFTPVFRLVEELQKNGRLKNLKGLLYFTDGDGVYPTERPGYETAFVFLDEALKKGKPPVWAHSLTLDLCEETTT